MFYDFVMVKWKILIIYKTTVREAHPTCLMLDVTLMSEICFQKTAGNELNISNC